MSPIKTKIKNIISELIKDLEEASPNTRRSFYELYPLSFKIEVKGHFPIYVDLDRNTKKIGFAGYKDLNFEINAGLDDLINIVVKKKIAKQIIQGDVELAMVFFNLIEKSNVDIIYLVEKHFGNNAAFISSQLFNKIFLREGNIESKAGSLHKQLRDLHIRIDRLEARSY